MASIPLIDLGAQYRSIQPEIDRAIQDVIASSAFIGGPFVKTFEAEFAAYCGLPHGVGVSSGTTALHLALAALGIGPGDEVITVPNTFIATVETIVQTGARPVFVDVEENTLNMDPAALEAAITPRTRAVIPVHLYGHMAEMDAILNIARAHDLLVLEDAAQAHGAAYKKKRAGHFGAAATFSFFPGKILGAYGDAGIVLTSDLDLAGRMEMLANHGRLEKYTHRIPGYNYRIDALQAAILSVKLKHLDDWLRRRRARAHLYNRLFSGSEIQPPVERPHAHHVYTYYVIRTSKRDAIQETLQKAGIDTVIHYPIPLHLQPAFENLGYSKGAFPVAEREADRILSLPLYPELEDGQIQKIANHVLEA